MDADAIDANRMDADWRIAHITLDERSIVRRSPDIEQERRIAIFDLLEGNRFVPQRPLPGDYRGPFRLGMGVEEGRLVLELAAEDGSPLVTHQLALGRFRRPIRDYFAICDSYFRAVRENTPQRIETIDMARRAVHNDAATALAEALASKVEVDFDTARRLFTLICVLHIRS